MQLKSMRGFKHNEKKKFFKKKKKKKKTKKIYGKKNKHLKDDEIKSIQYELSLIKHDIKNIKEDNSNVYLRYIRRLTIFSNIFLGSWLFFTSLAKAGRKNTITKTFLSQILMPNYKNIKKNE